MTKTKKEEKLNNEEINIDEIMINSGKEKYDELVLAMKWAYHLKNLEEYKTKTASEIIDKALLDVFTHKVSEEDIRKAMLKDEETRIERIAERKRERAEAVKNKANLDE